MTSKMSEDLIPVPKLADFATQEIGLLVMAAHDRLAAKFGPARLAGRNRLVFESKYAVFKLPRNDMGMADNAIEASRYRRGAFPYPMAACRLLQMDGGIVLMMQKVDTLAVRNSAAPTWVSYVDCAQAGTDRRGQFLAYDYA